MAEQGGEFLADQDLAALGVDRLVQAQRRAQRQVAEAGGQDHPFAGNAGLGRAKQEAAPLGLDLLDRVEGKIAPAQRLEGVVQGVQQE